MRVVVGSPCEHGMAGRHGEWGRCPGGRLRVLDGLPDDVIEAAATAYLRTLNYPGKPTTYDVRGMRVAIQVALDALVGTQRT